MTTAVTDTFSQARSELWWFDAEQHFWGMYTHSPFGLMLSDSDARIRMANLHLSRLLHYEPGSLVGAFVPDLIDPRDLEEVMTTRTNLSQGRAIRTEGVRRFVCSDGNRVAVRVTTFVVRNEHGAELGHASIVVDLTETERLSRRLEHVADIDQLTGLASRLALRRELASADRASGSTVVFVDLDGFGSVNTAFGADTEDTVLVEVAHRLAACSRPATVARVGGDEFAIVYPALTSGDHAAEELTARIRQQLAEPIATSSGPVWVSASIGICDGTVPAKNGIQRLQRAETAAAAAKRAGTGTALSFDPVLNRAATERARTEPLLRTAIDDDRVIVHFQPIVDLRSGAVRGFEALARLARSDCTLVSPDVFIPAAESTGMIVPIGAHILRRACQAAAKIRTVYGDLTMSVNVSACQVARPDFPDTVTRVLAETELPPTALMLELTESMLLSATPDATRRLEELRNLGIGIALDDFGTGYSSLTYLRTFPITRVKIDKSFIDRIVDDPISAGIIHGVTMIAADLGLSWVAEGIETAEQRAVTASIGRGYGQGYLFAKPLPEDHLTDYLRGVRSDAVATGQTPRSARAALSHTTTYRAHVIASTSCRPDQSAGQECSR